jgi:hypothetical protein
VTEGRVFIAGLFAFAIWLFVGLPWIIYPSEKVKYVPVSSETATKSDAKPDGSAQAPLSVQIIRSFDSAEKRADEAQERQEKRESDAALVAWTKVLAFATIGLIAATAILGYFGLQQSRDMKDSIAVANRANELDRRNFEGIHRPKIRVKHLLLAGGLLDGKPILVNLTCVNNGTANAFIQRIGLRYFIVQDGQDLPIIPAIPTRLVFGGQIIESGLNYEFREIPGDIVLTTEQNADIQERRAKLFCIGFVSYEDAAKRTRITGFCRELTFVQDAMVQENCRFRVFKDPDYEYED